MTINQNTASHPACHELIDILEGLRNTRPSSLVGGLERSSIRYRLRSA